MVTHSYLPIQGNVWRAVLQLILQPLLRLITFDIDSMDIFLSNGHRIGATKYLIQLLLESMGVFLLTLVGD